MTLYSPVSQQSANPERGLENHFMIEDCSGAYTGPPGKLILFTAQLLPRASISLQLDLRFAHFCAPKQFGAFSLLASSIRRGIFPQYITIKRMSGEMTELTDSKPEIFMAPGICVKFHTGTLF